MVSAARNDGKKLRDAKPNVRLLYVRLIFTKSSVPTDSFARRMPAAPWL